MNKIHLTANQMVILGIKKGEMLETANGQWIVSDIELDGDNSVAGWVVLQRVES